jgi:hypothetical protein
MSVDDNIELGYTRVVEEPERENRVIVYLTIGLFFVFGLFIGGIYVIGYLFAKKIWL